LNALPPIDFSDATLFQRVVHFPRSTTLQELCANRALLRSDLEFGTALLYNRVLREPQNVAFQNAICESRAKRLDDTVFGVVPGAFYRHHKNTGAEGDRIIKIVRELGGKIEVIPIRSFGRLHDNAQIILDWLRIQKAPRLALITLSKGSADCKVALQLSRGTGWERVGAWISISGLTEGTPLIAWLRRQPLRMLGVRALLALRAASFAAADDLRSDENNPLQHWPPLPPSLRLIHVMAFATRRHLKHPWAFRAYERLAPLGPNDGGGILLTDTARLPGIVCPVWGADHYLQPAWDSTELLRRIVVESVGGDEDARQATVCAKNPAVAPAIKSSA